MNYDIEADWITNLLCNYNCEYCFLRSDVEAQGVLALEPKQYAEFFEKTGKTWMLHMSGGEPFIHDKAVDVMAEVTKKQFLSINTNGTQTVRINKFIDTVCADRVEYIHIGLHSAERTKRNGWETLFKNMRKLKEYGHTVFASLVMEPKVLDEFQVIYTTVFNSTGCLLLPKLLRDSSYPKGYTHRERELLRTYTDMLIDAHPEIVNEPFTINPIIERDYLQGFPDFRGHSCRAGKDFVKIDEHGLIWRCEMNERLGNIVTGELNLHPSAYNCNETYCPYYCLKYSSLTGKQ